MRTNFYRYFLLLIIMLFAGCKADKDSKVQAGVTDKASNYQQLKNKLMQGWGTWNSHDILSYSLLPDGLEINLDFIIQYKNLRDETTELYPGIDNKETGIEVKPLGHTLDGSYTALKLSFKDIIAEIETAAEDNNLSILVKTLQKPDEMVFLTVKTGILWNKPGIMRKTQDVIIADFQSKKLRIGCSEPETNLTNVNYNTPYFSIPLKDSIWITIGEDQELETAQDLFENQKNEFQRKANNYGNALSDSWKAIVTSLGFNTIYDPGKDRVVSTVARSWNVDRGGYAFFGWDNFFLSYLCALEDKNLAFANIIEHLNDKTPGGFIPNASQGNGRQTLDRSQPPVGSMMVKEIYKKYPEKWFLEEVFDDLLTWNRWWMQKRYYKNMLCWGSHDGGNPFNDNNYNNFGGAILETGLDDSPMYLDVPFNSQAKVLELHDVGLNALYIEDCESLAEIASILDRQEEAKELNERAEMLRAEFKNLWSEEEGIYLNKRTDSGSLSKVLAPTLFYAWITDVPSEEQTRRMLNEHFFNEKEFWGDYVLPSVSRDNPWFSTQKYWKGAIWGPLNFLTYLSLREAGLKDEASKLAVKSNEIFRAEWLRKGYVSENYSSIDGSGDHPSLQSNRFYTWGALMGIMIFMEEGHLPAYELNVE